MNYQKQITLLVSLLFIINTGVNAISDKPVIVKSPNGKVNVEIKTDTDSKLYYQIKADGKEVISCSRLGIVSDNADLGANIQFGTPETKQINETYPVFGVHSKAINRCNETTIPV